MNIEYDYKHVGNRQCYLENVEPPDVDDCFKLIVESFGQEWLEKDEGNVIQSLWNRPDNLATHELYALGYALRNLRSIDPAFVSGRVKDIVHGDERVQNGALFELFALNAFLKNTKVLPAKENNPGYDGVVALKDDKTIKLSIKNYSLSAHHVAFLKKAREVEELVKILQAKYNCPPIEIIITKKSGYPSAAEWDELLNNMEGLFANMPNFEGRLATGAIGDWGVIQRQISSGDGKFSTVLHSYTLILSAPFHKNEEKNLHDKLEEACANLVKHSAVETSEEKNVVIIHLPRIASRKNCEQWARNYLDMYPDKPISSIILYQPLVVSSGKKDDTYIANGLSVISRDQLVNDFGTSRLNIQFPVGKAVSTFGEHTIFVQHKPDEAIKIVLENAYVFQRGHHYFDAESKDGQLTGSMGKIASGVFKHSILKIGEEFVELTGKFAPEDTLRIL